MQAAVLGATGFIGGHVVRALNNAKIDVRVVRRSRGPALALKDLAFEDFHGDLDDVASLKNALEGIDVVFNTAGYYPIYSSEKERQKSVALAQIRNFIQAVADCKISKISTKQRNIPTTFKTIIASASLTYENNKESGKAKQKTMM
jgi:nucleoside-diphosphate-sugar epimerase